MIFYYLKKGLFFEKIKGYQDIISNRKKILNRYHELEKNREKNDKEIIKNFEDEVFVPEEVASQSTNKIFNKSDLDGYKKNLGKA